MRLLLTSDLHYNLRHLDWVLAEAADFDVVVLAGDHLDIISSVALESQWVVVERYLARLAQRTRVIACSGNHDLTGRNAHGEKVASWLPGAAASGSMVDWDSADIDGVRLTVCPWWDGPRTREDVDVFLRAQQKDRPARWVWVYHPPPSSSPTAQGARREYGDTDLRAWIDELQPDVVLSGHVHEAPFVAGGSWWARHGSTMVFNAGRSAAGMIPNHVIMDFDACCAEWWGGGASDTTDLPSVTQ